LLALLPLLYFLFKFWKTFFGFHSHGLRLPPGPWQLSVIGSLHHLRGSLVHCALRDLSIRHGPLMFLKFGKVPVKDQNGDQRGGEQEPLKILSKNKAYVPISTPHKSGKTEASTSRKYSTNKTAAPKELYN
ncbi:hypothetical protein BAE44_0009054, partial [Dichanthelium oligosanthes]